MDRSQRSKKRAEHRDAGWAQRMLALHVPLALPDRTLCRHCGSPHPCGTRRLALRVLANAGPAPTDAEG